MDANKPAEKYLDYSEHSITEIRQSASLFHLDSNHHILSVYLNLNIFPLYFYCQDR